MLRKRGSGSGSSYPVIKGSPSSVYIGKIWEYNKPFLFGKWNFNWPSFPADKMGSLLDVKASFLFLFSSGY